MIPCLRGPIVDKFFILHLLHVPRRCSRSRTTAVDVAFLPPRRKPRPRLVQHPKRRSQPRPDRMVLRSTQSRGHGRLLMVVAYVSGLTPDVAKVENRAGMHTCAQFQKPTVSHAEVPIQQGSIKNRLTDSRLAFCQSHRLFHLQVLRVLIHLPIHVQIFLLLLWLLLQMHCRCPQH